MANSKVKVTQCRVILASCKYRRP